MNLTWHLQSWKVVFPDHFFSQLWPSNVITIYAFIPEILALELVFGANPTKHDYRGQYSKSSLTRLVTSSWSKWFSFIQSHPVFISEISTAFANLMSLIWKFQCKYSSPILGYQAHHYRGAVFKVKGCRNGVVMHRSTLGDVKLHSWRVIAYTIPHSTIRLIM